MKTKINRETKIKIQKTEVKNLEFWGCKKTGRILTHERGKERKKETCG